MNKKKLIKKIIKGTGIVVLVIILLAFLLPFIFQKKIVEMAKKSMNDNLTARVEFSGYGLSLFRSFPNFTLNLENLSVAGTEAFANDTLLSADDLFLTLDLFSVLAGNHYVIRKISMKKPRILLKTLEDGKVNWDIAKASAGTSKASGEVSAFKLSIDKISVEQGSMVYNDESLGIITSLDDITMTLKADINGDIYNLSTQTSVKAVLFSYGGVAYLKKASADLHSDIVADMKNFKFTFSNSEMQLNQLLLGFDGWFAMPADDILLDMKFSAGKSEFKSFLSLLPAIYAKDFNKLEAKGTLSFDGFVKGTYNEKTIPGFAVNLLVGDAMFKYPDLPAAVTNITVDANIGNKDGIPDNTVLDLRKLHVEMAGNPVDIQMLVKTPVSDPSIKGRVKGKLNLADVKKFYPLDAGDQLSGTVTADVTLNGRMSSIENKQYENFQADGDVSVSGMSYRSKDVPQGLTIHELKLQFSPQFVNMPAADIRFGKSDLKASGKLLNVLAFALKGEKLTGAFESQSTLLDLNEFMPTDTTAASNTSAGMSVFRVPENISFTAKTRIGKLFYDNMQMSNVNGQLTIGDQQLSLDQLAMEMLGGTMVLTGTYNTKPKQPLIDFNLLVKHFDVPQCYKTFVTVQKLAPVAEKCSGKVSVKMKMSSELDSTMLPVYESLYATGTINGENLEVKDFVPMNKLAETLKIDKFRNMKIGNASMEIIIAKGRLEIKPFQFAVDKIKTTVSGWNSLDQTISYDAVMEIPREMFGGQANSVLDGMVKKAGSKGITIDPGSTLAVAAKITGTFTKPEVTADLKSSVNSAITEIKQQVIQQVTEKVQEQINQVKEDLSAKAQKIIADAGKQAQQIREEAKKAGDLLVSQAEKQGQDLVNNASNPIAKAAAKETAKQLVKQAKSKSDKLQQEADARAVKLLDDAKKEADKLK